VSLAAPHFRKASRSDLVALAELERDANLEGLSHVFAPERHPFPFDDVMARWGLVLEDPSARVLVVDDDEHAGRLAAFVAFDDRTLRHLAVHPERWGTGLATAAVGAAVSAMTDAGCVEASLWVLEENHRARDLYARLGWSPTSEARPAPWPPYPVERCWIRRLSPPS
jgi:GNAT superfamily N-acetyltransferase